MLSDLEGVRAALLLGATPNPPRWAKLRRLIGLEARAPLVIAVQIGDLPIVLELLNTGADCNQVDDGRSTSLAMASREGRLEIAEALIKYGADVSQKIEGKTTPICLASFYGKSELVQLLLASGARPSDVLDGSLGSLIRIKGAILRQLVAAGGKAPREIISLLGSKQALGDFSPSDSVRSGVPHEKV